MPHILRAASRGPEEPLDILVAPTHERTESNLCKTGHRFWAWRGPQVKDWNTKFAPLPPNYVLLDPAKGEGQLPQDVEFDLVLSQNRFGQMQQLAKYSALLHVPLATIEHTLPHPSWDDRTMRHMKGMKGHKDFFISSYSRKAWGWGEDEAEVVHHGVDTETFKPKGQPKEPFALSVVNQFREPVRLWCCGYEMWAKAMEGLPYVHFGDSSDGWSRPAHGVEELVDNYDRCAVFVDTASFSPIPTVLLEAMSCGAVVVSRGNAMVPEIVRDGVNGFIRPTEEGMREQVKAVLADPGKFAHIGAAARATIREHFSLERFVKDWDKALRRAAAIPYRGEFN